MKNHNKVSVLALLSGILAGGQVYGDAVITKVTNTDKGFAAVLSNGNAGDNQSKYSPTCKHGSAGGVINIGCSPLYIAPVKDKRSGELIANYPSSHGVNLYVPWQKHKAYITVTSFQVQLDGTTKQDNYYIQEINGKVYIYTGSPEGLAGTARATTNTPPKETMKGEAMATNTNYELVIQSGGVPMLVPVK